MTIEELNKIIQEELKAYLNEEQTDEAIHGEDGDDDIEVTTDEPEEGGENEALDTLKQIYNMLKPIAEPEDEEPEMDMDDEEADDEEGEEEEMDEAVGYPNYKADQVSKVKADAEDVNKGLNESVERFKKLANIKG
jgi:hypothetical protein